VGRRGGGERGGAIAQKRGRLERRIAWQRVLQDEKIFSAAAEQMSLGDAGQLSHATNRHDTAASAHTSQHTARVKAQPAHP